MTGWHVGGAALLVTLNPDVPPPPPPIARQAKELEELCAAQQNSLEEGEEKFRALQDEQDQLHHAALAAKAQLVTAQAQVRQGRAGQIAGHSWAACMCIV